MIKKINIFLVLLLLLIFIGAVSAADEGNMTDIVSSEAIQDTIEVSIDEDIDYSSYDSDGVVDIDDESSISSATPYTITNDNYNVYFNSKTGELISSSVKDGDIIELDGSFSGKSFVFNKPVIIVGTSTNDMKNSMITLLNGASGSSITNLRISNTNAETYGIFLNSANNCSVKGCNINNSGKSSYCICLANGANYNNVTDNYLKAYGITYGHDSNSRSTPPLLLSGSHYNYVANNHVEADDANGIYLSSYSGGPLNGGDSNYNVIYNNIIHYNVLPTSWAYGIQVMGSNNKIESNTVIGGYRGISTSVSQKNLGYNTIINNFIINLTGADYNHPGVETGGEYAIVASYNTVVINNTVIGAKVISTGAGITAIDNSVVENNWVNVTEKGRGIVGSGSNVIIRNNVIFTESGSGVYEKDEGSGLLVENNNITSVSGVGILIEQLSSKRMPKYVTIIGNIISTNNKYAIDASGVQADTSDIDPTSNTIIGKGLIKSPAGVIDTSKPTYIYKGQTHTITPENIRDYINDNGGLTSEISDKDILNFEGTFSNEVIYITKQVKITGKNPIFYNSTFKVTCGNVLIENLTIINKEAERVNAWGIFVNQAPGVRIQNNNISVTDPKASYAIYVLQSTNIDVWNNVLYSNGDYLTFTLLAYACEDCNFANNTIHTIGTGQSYQFSPEKCIDGNELVINGKSYCLDGEELVIDGTSYRLNGTELIIDGVSYCLDGNEFVIDGTSYCIDGSEFVIDGRSYCIDGNEFVIDGTSYCIDGNEFAIDGTNYCLDGNEFVIDGTSYCIDGNEFAIDGIKYCLDGNEITIDGKSYCLDGNEITIDGKSYCLDGNEITIDGTKYCLDGGELVIDGKSYCLDGNEITIDGTKYCLDGGELVIDGKSYCLDGNEITIDGTKYCLDGGELVIDGKSYCLDGGELVIDGKSYCVDGSEYCMDGAHVVSEIYQTYGILLLYSSNNIVSGNDVNATSKLAQQQSTIGNKSSQNSVVGIDLYFNSHNNTFSSNNVYVKSMDNYIYGMGVLGYYTGHNAPEGQGATNNSFIGNEITLEGIYCVEGIIIGDESEDTFVEDNIINIKSDACAYGIYFELSHKSTVKSNDLTLNSQAIYGIEGYGSNNNVLSNNVVNANGKDVYGVIFLNGNDNNISSNKINANGSGENITVIILDSIGTGNAGIYLMANSTNNYIGNNEIKSNKGYAISLDDESVNNIMVNNYLDSENGIGNKAVSNSNDNGIYDNYKYIANASNSIINVPYLGAGELSLTFGNELDGAIVKFYDLDNNEIGQSNVSDGVAILNYTFDESYFPAQYIFSAKLIKEDYKSSTYEIYVDVNKGNIVIYAADVSIQQGGVGNIVAIVLDELGHPIKGAIVNFNRINSAGKSTNIGVATSNENGVATISYAVPSSLDLGDHVLTAGISGVDCYNNANTTFNLKVTNKSSIVDSNANINIVASDIKVTYNSGSYYYITVYGADGKLAKEVAVVVKVSGKQFATLKTNDNGVAKFKVTQNPGTYKITASALGKSVTKTLTVKHIIILKTVKIKKSAKKLVLTATLSKVNNKYLKNKKIIFKFKGKKYTAKTNKKGVAKLTIKSKVLKKLKVGKKVTYQATYLKDTVKKTVKVKK